MPGTMETLEHSGFVCTLGWRGGGGGCARGSRWRRRGSGSPASSVTICIMTSLSSGWPLSSLSRCFIAMMYSIHLLTTELQVKSEPFVGIIVDIAYPDEMKTVMEEARGKMITTTLVNDS